MDNELAAKFIDKINEAFDILGIADRYRLSWSEELHNEAISEGTITGIDTSDEFVAGIQLCKGGTYFTIYAEKSARRFLKNNARVGDYIKLRAYLKPVMFKGDQCCLFVDDEADILDLIHEGKLGGE